MSRAVSSKADMGQIGRDVLSAKTGGDLCYSITSRGRAVPPAWLNAVHSDSTDKDTRSADHYTGAASHMGSIELANRFKLSDFRPVHLFCERHHTSERRWIVTFGDGQRELD
jgi:hypothetical protein